MECQQEFAKQIVASQAAEPDFFISENCIGKIKYTLEIYILYQDFLEQYPEV